MYGVDLKVPPVERAIPVVVIDLAFPLWVFGSLDGQRYLACRTELLAGVLLVRRKRGALIALCVLFRLGNDCYALDAASIVEHDLFRMEAENQSQALIAALLALETNPTAPEHLEACMRSAHSLKIDPPFRRIRSDQLHVHAIADVHAVVAAHDTTLGRGM